MGTEERGPRPSSERESNLLLCLSLLKSTQNLAISRVTCERRPRNVQKGVMPVQSCCFLIKLIVL